MTRGLLAAALAAALLVPGQAIAQDDSNPLSAIGRMFGKRPSPPAGQEEGDAPTTEQVIRIERLENQIRQLTGELERLQYRNQQLENQLRSAGVAPAGAAPSPVTAAPPPAPPAQNALTQQAPRAAIQAAPLPSAAGAPPPAPGRRSDVFDPAQNPNAPGAPRPLGGMSGDPQVIAADPPVGAPRGRGAGGPLDLSTMSAAATPPSGTQDGLLPAPPSRNPSATGAVAAVAPPTDSPKDIYDLGYGYVLRKDYALAEDTFQAFLKKYPNDRRAAEAEFWLGESLFQRQKYETAAQSFLEVSTKYGSHAKAPEALLRLAQSLSAMKQKEMSCATLAEVGRKYPKAPASVKQGVEREQKRVRC